MLRVPAAISSIASFAISLCLIPGCAMTPEAPAGDPVAIPVSAVAPVSAEPDRPAVRSIPAVPVVARPAVHVTNAPSARPAVLTTRRQDPQPAALPVKFVEQALASGIGAPVPGKTSRPAGKEVAKAGPAWLKACQHRQQQADVIMCDADSLLAPPSDKVMVYVRDAKLSGKQADGQRIALRESLPRLYRIFVLD